MPPPARGRLDLPIVQPADVPHHHHRFDAGERRQGPHQPAEGGLTASHATAASPTVQLLGNPLTFRATAETTDGQFSLVECRTAPGERSPPHLQRDDIAAFDVLEGSYEFHLGGSAPTCGRGGFVFVPKGVPHRFRNPRAGRRGC